MEVTVARRYRFEAAHALPWHPGKCRGVHGHSYVLEVFVLGELDSRGVVMDFAEIDEVVEKYVLAGPEGLDHQDLNRILENPTAELVAIMIGDRLATGGLPWSTIRLWETANGSVVIHRQ